MAYVYFNLLGRTCVFALLFWTNTRACPYNLTYYIKNFYIFNCQFSIVPSLDLDKPVTRYL